MAYDYTNELKRVRDYYAGDPLQKRFSALVTGGIGAGKTYLLHTARRPVHIDSFDPGGTKCLRELIAKGDIVADTEWESEDPMNPDKFAKWMRAIDIRLQSGYFDHFGTYCLDSATTWGDAVMGYQLKGAGRAGEAPKWSHDYVPQKVFMTNYIRKLMSLPCDFILTGHLREIEEVLSVDVKTGVQRKNVEYRFYTTGQAVLTIPLLFDEIYVLLGEMSSSGVKRTMLIDSQGKYIARSRLRANGKLNSAEEPSIKELLKKIGLNWEDKPKLELDAKAPNQ
jgi:hypothetical protein